MKADILENEFWWGGIIHHGSIMPLSGESEYTVDLRYNSAGNQSSPLFVSTCGRVIWSESPFKITFSKGTITVDGGPSEAVLYEGGASLRDAFLAARRNHFCYDIEAPDSMFFLRPQYNTWAELTYNQNQTDILEYAQAILSHGYEPGVIILDDTWQVDYGVWRFNTDKFRSPREMVDCLHNMGFTVMLWVCPFVSPDSMEFRMAVENPNRIVRDINNEPLIFKWWNGYSAALDMTREDDCAWMRNSLDWLMHEYGIDGFKFDNIGIEDYPEKLRKGLLPETLSSAWVDFAASYRFHEVKDTWKACGRALVQRERDKNHSWDGEGLACMIPDAFAMSLTGHSYICPDMVGGGEWTNFVNDFPLDQELIVRYAQCSVFFPMVQFSVAPWRILSAENANFVRQAHDLRHSLAEEIYSIAQNSAVSGEPMLRPMCYEYSGCGYETINDQFFLGKNILVAPVLTPGTYKRQVILPDGIWEYCDGISYIGPLVVQVDSPLHTIPWFKKCIKLLD